MTDKRLQTISHLYHPPPGMSLWHGGASVVGSLRGVAHEQAAWKPAPDRSSIWELTLHVAYWKYAVWRRVVGGQESAFPRSPSNFPKVPEPSQEAWAKDKRLLREYHDRLAEAIESFDPELLDRSSGGKGKYSFADLLFGVVLHDTYHAGQIQMLKRLYASLGGS